MAKDSQMGDLISAVTAEVRREGTRVESLSHGEKVGIATMGYLMRGMREEVQTIKAAVSLPIWVAAAGLFGNLAWRVFELVVLGLR